MEIDTTFEKLFKGLAILGGVFFLFCGWVLVAKCHHESNFTTPREHLSASPQRLNEELVNVMLDDEVVAEYERREIDKWVENNVNWRGFYERSINHHADYRVVVVRDTFEGNGKLASDTTVNISGVAVVQYDASVRKVWPFLEFYHVHQRADPVLHIAIEDFNMSAFKWTH